MKWYYVENGQQAGPVEETEFPSLVSTGRLRADTLVWREGMVNWEPFSKACPNELAATATTATVASGTEAVCVECGGIFDTQEMIPHGNAHVCARCKPVFLQKLAEGVQIRTGELRYAGFWIRVVAKIVDALIVTVPLVGLVVLSVLFVGSSGTAGGAPLWFNFVGVFAQLLYYGLNLMYVIFFVGKYGATPGKMLCKLRIVTATGEKVTYGRATGRAFAEILSGLICNIGYLIVAFDKEKRSLHDHICNTRVVYK